MADTKPCRIRIEGTLAENATLTYTAGLEPTAVLSLTLTPVLGLPYFVRQVVGKDPSAHIAAAAKARMLKRGAEVVVYAEGLRTQHDHNVAGLLVMGVSHVLPTALAPKGAEPATTTTNTTTEERAA